jgi:excisionase family DNA binding protein
MRDEHDATRDQTHTPGTEDTTTGQATTHNSTHHTPRRAYTVREVAALLGISRESVFGLLRTGQLRSILIGKRGRRVTDVQLDAYLRTLEGRPPDGP